LIIPAILSLGVAVFVAWVAWKTSEDVIINLLSIFNLRQFSGFLGDMIDFMFRMVIRGLTLFLYLKIFRYLLLIVLSPSLHWISGKIQSIALRESHEFIFKRYFKHVLRSMEIAVLNFIRDILLTAVVVVVSIIITWLAPLAPFAIFFVESYFFGYTMIDYRNLYFNMSIKESGAVIQRNSGLALGNGICFNLILLIPVIGIMLGPTLALIAAGISIDEAENKPVYDVTIDKSL
jgi:CysZ protein